VSATRSPSAGLTSIVVMCTHAEATRRCIAALRRHTRRPWELIAAVPEPSALVDELAHLAGDAPSRLEIVVVAANHPADPASAAAGFPAVRGEYVALIDGDAVVTHDWLPQLIALVQADPGIGVAGPMSNAVSPPQRVEDVPYHDEESLERFARRWRGEHRGQWFRTDTLSGLPCVLVKWAALEAATGLDQEEHPSDDLPRQIRRAGFDLAVAHDLFIHHGPWPTAATHGKARAGWTRIVGLSQADFARDYGDPDTSRALCGFTPPGDTHAVLTLLAHARPRLVLEIGTALGHMTANLTEWSPESARIVSLGIVRGMPVLGALEQVGEAPRPEDLGRLAGHFGKRDKAEILAADTRAFDFARLEGLDFAFIDGGHSLDQVVHDSRAVYETLSPGGWLVWHDLDNPAPWVEVRRAIEQLGFREVVRHVDGTMVAFLRKGEGETGTVPATHTAPLRLTWEGDIDGLHSLGLINRELGRALLGRGVDLGLMSGVAAVTPDRLPPVPVLESRRGKPPSGGPPEVWVAHRWPPRLEPPPTGRWVFFQPWEYGSLPRAWLPAARQADEVWAYSRAVRDIYLDAGLHESRVHVVPLGVDPEVFGPGREPAPLPPGPRFRFLFVGGTIHRKGIDLLLTAFERAFGPDDGVGLVVKDMGSQSFYRGQTAGAAIAALRERGYPVEHLESPLPPHELVGLYAACDCLVHPYRGEGFALPVAEAMACGKPVIVTGEGPARDYASDATAYLVPARRVELAQRRVGDVETVGRPWLWEPDIEALVSLMRRVVDRPAEARAKGKAAAASIRERFTWDQTARAVEARLQELRARPRPQSPGVPGSAARPRVSLTMIVRDEEANLPACLGSVRGLFDEIVVVDTGSVDRTPEIARSFGARVFDFVWVGDFAAARNAALARATGDYAFWLDADDVLDPPQHERLKALLDGLRLGDDASYVVRCACEPDLRGGGETVVDHVRLFPLREEVRWTYRVHEQILPGLRQAGIAVRWSDVVVRHTGYTDPALRGRKLGRDEAILREELEDRPGDPFVLFNLGSIAIERQDWRTALGHLSASLAGSGPTDSITRKLHALIARSHQMLGDPGQALAACAAGLEIDPDDAELLFREAVIRRHTGDRAGAEERWRRVLTLKRPERFSSVDTGIYGHLTRRNLAVLAEERGDRAEALRLWEAVAAELPGDREAIRMRQRLEAPAGGEAAP
jgi:glycosyltransferase involved in cell wall biosynthesis/GT2 family glycosyltransferase